MVTGLFFPPTPVAGQNVPILTDAGVESAIKNLPCPSQMREITQLSGRIPIGQYVGPANERQAAMLREALIDGAYVKTCRAPTPTGKWQTTYHSVVVRTATYAPEYGTRALDGVVSFHTTRVQNGQKKDLENPGGASAPEGQAVAVTGQFVRSSGDVDNVHLYHFVYRHTVNWMLIQAVTPLLPLNVVPDPDSWRLVQAMYAELGKLR